MPRSLSLLTGPAALALAFSAAGCGATSRPSGSPAGPRAAQTSPSQASSAQLRSVRVVTAGSLPGGLAFPAVAGLPDGRVVLLGGLDDSGGSTASVSVLSGGNLAVHGALPIPQHDAQAAVLGGEVYVFGGGGASTYAHILRYDPATGAVSQVGELPAPASDVAVATIGQTAYVVGGYDGTRWLDTVVAWRPGTPARVVAHMPTGLRYAAVAAVGPHLIIAGGTTPNSLSDAILSFDPARGSVARLGRLPVPLAHMSAAAVDNRILIIGGRRQNGGDRTATILAVDPGSGAVRPVGRLPQPLSDMAVTQRAGRVLVLGGETSDGPQRAILAVIPALSS